MERFMDHPEMKLYFIEYVNLYDVLFKLYFISISHLFAKSLNARNWISYLDRLKELHVATDLKGIKRNWNRISKPHLLGSWLLDIVHEPGYC